MGLGDLFCQCSRALNCGSGCLHPTCSAVNKPKFMGRPLDHLWCKTGLPESFLGCQNYFGLSLKEIWFLVVNTSFACFLFNLVPTYWGLGLPSGDFGVILDRPTKYWVAFGDWETSYPQHCTWIQIPQDVTHCKEHAHDLLLKSRKKK